MLCTIQLFGIYMTARYRKKDLEYQYKDLENRMKKIPYTRGTMEALDYLDKTFCGAQGEGMQ